jgi:hypothetical protein
MKQGTPLQRGVERVKKKVSEKSERVKEKASEKRGEREWKERRRRGKEKESEKREGKERGVERGSGVQRCQSHSGLNRLIDSNSIKEEQVKPAWYRYPSFLFHCYY